MIVRLTEWLASYFLAQRFYTGEQANLSEMVKQYMKDYAELVNSLEKNMIDLVDDAGNIVSKKDPITSLPPTGEGFVFPPPDKGDEDIGVNFMSVDDRGL